jgi:hypothetical protein
MTDDELNKPVSTLKKTNRRYNILMIFFCCILGLSLAGGYLYLRSAILSVHNVQTDYIKVLGQQKHNCEAFHNFDVLFTKYIKANTKYARSLYKIEKATIAASPDKAFHEARSAVITERLKYYVDLESNLQTHIDEQADCGSFQLPKIKKEINGFQNILVPHKR